METNGSIESPEINPHTYGQVIPDKGPKTIRGKRTTFSASSVKKLSIFHEKKKEIGPFLYTTYKN